MNRKGLVAENKIKSSLGGNRTHIVRTGILYSIHWTTGPGVQRCKFFLIFNLFVFCFLTTLKNCRFVQGCSCPWSRWDPLLHFVSRSLSNSCALVVLRQVTRRLHLFDYLQNASKSPSKEPYLSGTTKVTNLLFWGKLSAGFLRFICKYSTLVLG